MTEITDKLQQKINSSKSIIHKLIDENDKVVFANSLGAEDMVITDIILKEFPTIEIFSLDTGRLPIETYELIHKVEQHYDYKLRLFYPDTTEIEKYTYKNGINGFYQSVDLRKECCHIRKVEPLKRALAQQDAWITGMRRSQSKNREHIAEIEYDESNSLYKANPLADWEETDVWNYIKAFDVPYNKLHDKHYPSIGCAPCTRAITIGEDIRSGRWWWENTDAKECGLHISETDTK